MDMMKTILRNLLSNAIKFSYNDSEILVNAEIEKPGAAEEICPAHIPEEWEKKVGEAALAVFQTIGLAVYARADFIVTEDGTPYFLEINTLPGMTPTSLVPQEAAAVGIDYPSLCEIIIQRSLEARKEGM